MRGRARLTSALRTAGLWSAPAVFLALFYARPLAEVLRLSLARGASVAAPFAEALASPVQREIFGFTLLQAGLSTLLTLALGLPGAYLLARFDFRGRSLLQALTAVPFVMPTLVVGAAFHALLGPHGWANVALMALFHLPEPPLRVIHSLGAILLAHVFYNTSIVLRLVGDFWSHLDPRLDAAARTLGADRRQVLLRVTLPLLLPAIAAAALLVFLFDFTSFGVILVLGGPRLSTLEVEIYNQTVGLFNLPLAAALSIIQLGCTLLLTVLYTRLAGRLSRPISLRPRRQSPARSSGCCCS
jgi:thiamine transport system permease protein